MKKIANVLNLGVAILTLAACAGGSKVSYEKFKEEANKIEEHQYSSVTLKIVETSKGKEVDEEKLTADVTAVMTGQQQGPVVIATKDVDEKVEAEVTYTWDAEKEEWVSEDEDAEEYEDYAGMRLTAEMIAEFDPEAASSEASEYAEFNYDVTFYVNPLKIDLKARMVMDMTESLGLKATMDMKESVTMDKYGYVTTMSGESTITQAYDVEKFEAQYKDLTGGLIEFDASAIAKLEQKETIKVTASYK